MTQEEFSEKHLSHLNPQQKKAVQTVDGAALLLAVPGSGKTTVLVTRLGYMVYCKGIAPQSILTMTYTVAATREMKDRFAAQFGKEHARALEFRTINGLSAKIIDYYSRHHGSGQPFRLLTDGGEATRLVRQIHQGITGEYAGQSTIQDIATAITYIKNMMLNQEEIKELDMGVAQLPEIYDRYCLELRSRKLMDYDDQMKYALDILEQRPPVLRYFQDKYRYLCVDESQDTSKIQHAIIRILAGKHGNLFMVGDEDQSIYGFRAAYPEALMNFSREHSGAEVLFIEQNYRSTDEIVAAASAFVAKNRFRHEKKMAGTRGSGDPVKVIDVLDREAQYDYLFEVAKAGDSETAVLFRNNDSALPLIDRLDRSGVPYRCRQFDGSFFSHAVINDLTDIINFAHDQTDSEAFLRIYYKFGSPLSKKAVTQACQESMISGRTILEELNGYPELSSFAREGVEELMVLLPQVAESTGLKAIQLIKASGYGYYVDTKGLDMGKLDIMMMLGKSQPSAKGLLDRLTELQEIIMDHNSTSSGSFILSTIHSSKGLEYDEVYLLDIFDGILPAKPVPDPSSPQEIGEYEEARRLFYVGMTRAKNRLHLFICPDQQSAFIREVISALPDEQFAPDSIFASFPEKLCGRSYVHKDKGKGRITARNGQLLLVEYEEARLDLKTFFQLFTERKIIRTVRDTAGSKIQKKSGQRTRDRRGYSARDPKALSAQLVLGVTADHIKYGEGIVEQNDGTSVSIRFKRSGKVRKFAIKVAAEQGLIKVYQ